LGTQAEEFVDDRTVADAFRNWGYLEADLDTFDRLTPVRHPELRSNNAAAKRFREIYCGSIGIEFMHIPDPEKRRWIQERIEGRSDPVDRRFVLEELIKTDILEQLLQTRYLGNKRFSIKGVDALIPLLQEMLEIASAKGAERAILAMSHRGRLNVVARVVGRPPAEIFAGFEDVDPKSTLGGGDVKYHLGATGVYRSRNGRETAIHLVSNPSHLEAVDPVALGRTRARQSRLGKDGKQRIVPILLHGDAAFAGQGILAEVLNLAEVPGFSVGGTVHVIVNNLIGFTAVPEELYSSRFASDVAKRLPIPIVHVNAEDPDAVVRTARLAIEYRYAFSSDIVVDLIGYRLYGHSEIDDPTITQPVLYRKIHAREPLWKSYAEKSGISREETAEFAVQVTARFDETIADAKSLTERPVMRELPEYWEGYTGGRYDTHFEVETGISRNRIVELSRKLTSYPESFRIHPKVRKLMEQRGEMGEGKRPLDYGMAEALAFASLLEEGYTVRLSGQDSKRGTFSHRHSVLFDYEDGREYSPLKHLGPAQGTFEVYDSILSEAAVLGFEYGFSRDYPDGLILWEAQFGDFANGAQVIIDQFITAGEDKWELLSGMVLLLPHGYEGQGPEHSSARIERYLQLAARDNIQVVQPSNAAQYFHVLRRQVLRKWRKPLIVFSPKSMLRHPSAVSDVADLERPAFRNVIADLPMEEAERILVCSGKIGHELQRERDRRSRPDIPVVFLEQLYPFPESEVRALFERSPADAEIIWVQEEPANMGGLTFVLPYLQRAAANRRVRSVKRSATGTPATGSAKAHQVEQKTLLALAFARW